MARGDADFAVTRTVAALGKRLKDIRRSRGMTLQNVAEASGLSASMVSLVERGQASPSISTLVSLCDALSIHVVDLFAGIVSQPGTVVMRESQPAVRSSEGVTRRTILDDAALGIELIDYVFEQGAMTGKAAHHSGAEIGFILEGELEVEVGDESHTLAPGDAVHFLSSLPHRFANVAPGQTRAVWVNVHRNEAGVRWGDRHG